MVQHFQLVGEDGLQYARPATLAVGVQPGGPELKVVLLSAAENGQHRWPLVRKPFLQSDLMRVMADIGKVG